MKPTLSSTELTDFNSASLAGLGHVPASKLMALKKLYAHRPKKIAKASCRNAWDSASVVIDKRIRLLARVVSVMRYDGRGRRGYMRKGGEDWGRGEVRRHVR